MIAIRSAVLMVMLLAAPGLSAGSRDAVVGIWSAGNSILEIRETGSGLSAVVVAVNDARYRADEDIGEPGAPRRDDNNPDPELRSRPLVGLELLSDYRFDGRRWQGRIYDPETGNTYSSRMELDGERLKMRGYIGVPMLGRSQYFEPIRDCSERVQAMIEVSQAQLAFCD